MGLLGVEARVESVGDVLFAAAFGEELIDLERSPSVRESNRSLTSGESRSWKAGLKKTTPFCGARNGPG